jgi:hypothetical protein
MYLCQSQDNAALQTATSEHDQSAKLASSLPIVGAAGALLEQIDFALLGERETVDQFRDDLPRPVCRVGKHLAEQLRIVHRIGQFDCWYEGHGDTSSRCRFHVAFMARTSALRLLGD